MWRELSKDREVVWLGFDGGAFDLPAGTDEDMPVGLSEPRGRATALGPALEQALARAARIVPPSGGGTLRAPLGLWTVGRVAAPVGGDGCGHGRVCGR